MGNRKPLTDDGGEVRELTAKDLKHFRTVHSLPSSLARKLDVHRSRKTPNDEALKVLDRRPLAETGGIDFEV